MESHMRRDCDDRHGGGIPDPEPAAASGSVAVESVKSTPRRAESHSHLLIPNQPAVVGSAMRKTFCFGGSRLARRMSERAPMVDGCVFCVIASRAPTSTTALLYSVPYRCPHDDKVVAFCDINPSAFRHYLVIPIDHIPTVNSLHKTKDDHQLVSHMVKVGKDLLNQDAPNSEEHRFGFHQPPFNSVDHLHLHCLALPFIPSWRQVKYTPLGPLGGFIEAEKLLERIKPEAEVYS